MKTVKSASLLLAIFAFAMTATPSFADNGDEPKQITELRNQVKKLVKSPQLEAYGIDSDTKVHIRFMLNNDNEIVVLSTDTDNAYLDSFIKDRLNYKMVKIAPLKDKYYNVSIVFKNT